MESEDGYPDKRLPSDSDLKILVPLRVGVLGRFAVHEGLVILPVLKSRVAVALVNSLLSGGYFSWLGCSWPSDCVSLGGGMLQPSLKLHRYNPTN